MPGIGGTSLLLSKGPPGLAAPTILTLVDDGGFVRVNWTGSESGPTIVTDVFAKDPGDPGFTNLTPAGIATPTETYLSTETLLTGREWYVRHRDTLTGSVSANSATLVEDLVPEPECPSIPFDPPSNLNISNTSYCTGSGESGTPNYEVSAWWDNPIPAPALGWEVEIEWFENSISQGVSTPSSDDVDYYTPSSPYGGIGAWIYYRVRVKCADTRSAWATSSPVGITTNPCTGGDLLE